MQQNRRARDWVKLLLRQSPQRALEPGSLGNAPAVNGEADQKVHQHMRV